MIALLVAVVLVAADPKPPSTTIAPGRQSGAPQPGVVVTGTSLCPSAEEVNQALRPLLVAPASVPSVAVNEDPAGGDLLVEFRWPEQGAVETRKLPLGDASCAERARRVAVVVAAWLGEPAAQRLPAPALPPPSRAPAPGPEPSAVQTTTLIQAPAIGAARLPWRTELGAGVFLGLQEGGSRAGRLEMTRRPSGSGFGWTIGSTASIPVTRMLGSGQASWSVFALAAGVRARRSWSALSLEADLAPTGAAVLGWGRGYHSDLADLAWIWGGVAGVRLVGHGQPFQIWLDARVAGWAEPSIVRVETIGTTASPVGSYRLPSSELHLGLGVSFVVP